MSDQAATWRHRSVDVLLIEDNPDDVVLVQSALEGVAGWCFEVRHSECLSSGLRQMAATAADVVLLDLGLPDAAGLTALDTLLGVVNHPPIIVLTGLGDDDAGLESVHRGAQDFLPKGLIAKGALARAIRYAIERDRLAIAIVKSEQWARSVYENVADILFSLDIEPDGSFRFHSVNPAFLRATGLGADQVVGRLVTEVIPEPSLSLVLLHYREAVERRETVRWEEVSRYPSGEITGSVSVSPVFDERGCCSELVGTVVDITGMRRFEQKLQTQARELVRSNEELAHFNRLATGREMRVIELKQEVNGLAAKLGLPRPYPLAFLRADPASADAHDEEHEHA